jgi:hypothetical protein
MSAAALIPSLVPMFVVLAMRRAEARIHGQLTDAQALSPESAIPLSLRRSIDHRRLQGLLRSGAVRQPAADRYFLDLDGWREFQAARRRRVGLALSITLALVGIAFAVLFAMR